MRVLVVEDEPTVVDALVRGLRAEGFAVDSASDGEEGLWYATENAYDAIVLDIMLPRMNGFQVCRTLRERDVGTPILMLTAKEGELDEAEALDTGADDFLRKPFSFVVLVARLRALARRGTTTEGTTLTAGDLVYDAKDLACRRNGHAVELTAREALVLEFLLRHRGEVVTKTQILDGVWDGEFAGDPNIIEVYVARLRNKVDRPFGRKLISTVRGAGYRIDPDGG